MLSTRCRRKKQQLEILLLLRVMKRLISSMLLTGQCIQSHLLIRLWVCARVNFYCTLYPMGKGLDQSSYFFIAGLRSSSLFKCRKFGKLSVHPFTLPKIVALLSPLFSLKKPQSSVFPETWLGPLKKLYRLSQFHTLRRFNRETLSTCNTVIGSGCTTLAFLYKLPLQSPPNLGCVTSVAGQKPYFCPAYQQRKDSTIATDKKL